MIRILNLLVLILNTFVLIAGQFPNDVTDTQEYRNLVYILIIALILLILTDIFQGISEFIHSIQSANDTDHIECNKIIPYMNFIKKSV